MAQRGAEPGRRRCRDLWLAGVANIESANPHLQGEAARWPNTSLPPDVLGSVTSHLVCLFHDGTREQSRTDEKSAQGTPPDRGNRPSGRLGLVRGFRYM